jgi:hypothetical protein
MSIRTDYGQLAEKLDYSALERKLAQLAEREPPKSRRTAADVLEPLREKLLALHRKGWSGSQLVEELKAAGVPVSPARFRECLSRWTSNGKRAAKPRTSRAATGNSDNGSSTASARSKNPFSTGQSAFRMKDL